MSEPPADLPRPAGVILDLDGTLVDTVETRISAWMAVFAEERIAADRGHVAGLIGSDGRRLAREVAERAGMALDPGRDEAIDARSGAIFTAMNQDPQPLPGVRDLVGRLEAAGIPWAIATSSRREQVATSVEALNLAHRPLVVDGSHVEHAKPSPDLLLLAAEELHLPAGACWAVGDSIWDMRAASAAGMLAIGVTTGAVNADQLLAAGAQLVVASLAEIEV